MRSLFVFLFVLIPMFTLAANKYDSKLEQYVTKRIESRTQNGSQVPGLRELISKDATVEMVIDKDSFRCMGYASPNGNGKAVGVCLVRTFDLASNGDHLEIMYAVLISEEIEHTDNSRVWQLVRQQELYF